MATLWFYESDGKQQGPVGAPALKRLAETGKLRPSDLVWREGTAKKTQAQAVQGLFASRQGAPVEVVEVIEAEDEAEFVPEALAEVEATYRGGHPDLEAPIRGTLVVESTGLRFLFEVDEGEDEVQVPFRSVEDLPEPAKGDFPTEKMAEKDDDPGKPPRNRLAVSVRLRKQRCKVLFDVNGANRNEMNEEAQLLHKKARKAFDKASAVKPEPEPAPLSEGVEVVEDAPPPRKAAPAQPERKAAPAPVAPVAGKPFRVMRGNQVRGPYSLEELRGLMSTGGVREGDLIGVETWLPLATLGGLLAPGAGPAPPAAAPTQAQAPPQPKPAAAPMKSDDGLIAADDEFRLH